MKLGFIARNDLAGLEQDAAFAAERGLDSLEFNWWGDFEKLDADTVGRMKECIDKHGIRAAALGIWGFNHLSSDEAERKHCHELLDRAIGFAETLGAEILITGGGDIEGASVDEKAVAFAEVFPPYVEKARNAGLRIALYAVHGGSFLDSVATYEKVWEKVPDVGVKLDPANIMHHGDDPLEYLSKHGDKIYHVHIKEHLYLDGELVSQPAAGMGDVHWGKVFAFLHEADYDGHLIFEPHGPKWARGDRRYKMIRMSKRYIEQFLD